jgi:F0F1-type ATP synthase assembly protein I
MLADAAVSFEGTDHMWTLLVVAILLLLVSSPAYAYLDPGTGSMIVQGLLAALAALSAVVAAFWTRIRRFLSRRAASERAPGPDESPSDP